MSITIYYFLLIISFQLLGVCMLPCTFLGGLYCITYILRGLYSTTYIQYTYPYLYSTIVLLVTICYVPYIWEFILFLFILIHSHSFLFLFILILIMYMIYTYVTNEPLFGHVIFLLRNSYFFRKITELYCELHFIHVCD